MRIENIENRITRIEEKVEKQIVETAESKVFLQEISKRLEALKKDIDLLAQEQLRGNEQKYDRFSRIVERLIWAGVTIIGYIIGKGGL